MRKLWMTITLSLVAGQAWADGFALSVGQDLAAVDVFGGASLNNLGTRIGYQAGGLVFYGMIDYAELELQAEVSEFLCDELDCSNTTSREQGKLSLLSLGAGLRYLFAEAEAGRAVPYVNGGVFTVIPTTEVNSDDAAEDVSSFGVLVTGGAEYFFAPAFSLGGEVGLTYFQADDGDTVDLSTLQVVSAIQFNFYL